MRVNVVGLLFGTAFGFVIRWAHLTEYDVIRDMLLLRHADVFLLMMSAMATAAIGVRLLRMLRIRAIVERQPIRWTVQPVRSRHMGGSVVFGLGWAIAGTCPAPVAAQLGRGQFASVFTIVGVLLGIALHDWVRIPREVVARANPMPDAISVAGL